MFNFFSIYILDTQVSQGEVYKIGKVSKIILTGFEKFGHISESENTIELFKNGKTICIQRTCDEDLDKYIQREILIALEHLNNDYVGAELLLGNIRKEVRN